MEIKFDVYFKKNLGTLFKSNEVDLDGILAHTNLDLKSVDRLEANYKVGINKYTDNVSIVSEEERVIQIPFKSDVVKVGLNEFEIVAYMKNGDIKTSQTYTYNIDEAIGEGTVSGGSGDGHSHTNLTILNSITQTKINEWNNKANKEHTHSDYAEKNHTHNANEIEGLDNIDIDLSNYYTKNETYNKAEIDNKVANMGSGGSVDLSSYYTKSETDNFINNKADKGHTHSQYLTEHQDISHKADKENTYTKSQTDNKIAEEIAKAQLGGSGEVDLSAYATKNYVDDEISKIEQGSIVNQNGGLPLKIWAGTKLEYDSLIVKDEETIYLIDGHINSGSQTFTITNNLTNCTNSNAMQSITSGASYVATISADEGYKISKVTIMVNNVNVTSDVYSNGIITILNVTGDIVINVTCVESSNDEVIVEPPIYELSDVFVLDGANTIDTGVALFDRDKDFTIFIDFTGDSDSMEYASEDGYQFSLFRVKQSVSPWVGLDYCIHNINGTNTQARGEIIASSNRNGYYLGKMSTGVPKESKERQRYIVKRVKSEKKMYFYDNKGLIGSYSDPGDVSLNTFNTKVVIGGYEDGSTRKIKGTVYNFKIWEIALTDSEINALFEVI